MKFTNVLLICLLVGLFACKKEQTHTTIAAGKLEKLAILLNVEPLGNGKAKLSIDFQHEDLSKDFIYGINFGENIADMPIIYQDLNTLEDFSHTVYRLTADEDYFVQAYAKEGGKCYQSEMRIFIAK